MDYQILVVEDDPSSRELFVRNVTMLDNVEVLTAATGKEALAQIQNAPPHLVMLDINLPEMSGINVLKHVRQRLNLNAMQIVILTANTVAANSSAVQLADAVLEKPTRNAVVRETIQTLLSEMDSEQHEHECLVWAQRKAIDEVFSGSDGL